MSVNGLPLSLSCMALVVLVACGGDDTPEVKGTLYSPDAVIDPEQPDSFVHVMTRSMTERRPQELWQALPDSYRADVQTIVTEFSQQMDAEVYDRVFQIAGKFAQVVGEKKEYLIKMASQTSMMMPGVNQGQNWDALASVLTTLTSSEIATLDGLRSMKVDEFLTGTGASVIAQLNEFGQDLLGQEYAAGVEDVKSLRTSVISSTDEVAIVRITTRRQPTEEQAMIRVEGKWVPQQLADEWAAGVVEAKNTIAGLDLVSKRDSILAMLSGLDGVLDQMLAAGSEEDFNVAMAQINQMMMAAMMGGAMSEAMSGGASPADEDS